MMDMCLAEFGMYQGAVVLATQTFIVLIFFKKFLSDVRCEIHLIIHLTG